MERGPRPAIPGFVDWLVPFVMFLLGFAFLLGGAALLVVFDTNFLTMMIQEGSLRSDVFPDSSLVAISFGTVQWGGIGLILTGLGIWVAAAVFFRVQHRTQGSNDRPTWIEAIVGAVATFVFGFIPFSPLLGGAVAGYLHGGNREATLRVGGLSGLLAALPVVVVVLFLFGGMTSAAVNVGAVGGALFAIGAVVFALVFTVTFQVVLSAIGGLIGVHFSPERAGID